MWLLALLLLHDKSGDAILKRNIFCSDCRVTPKPKSLRLLATIVEDRRNQDHSSASSRANLNKAILPAAVICQTGGPCGWVATGGRVGDATIAAIEERRVLFDDGDALQLEKGDPPKKPKLEKGDPRLLDHPEELARTVTAVPDKDGVRIVALRPGSPLARLGLQRGDLVRAVNGCELAGLDAALACYQRLRNVRYVSVSLLRAGAPVTLDVALDRE